MEIGTKGDLLSNSQHAGFNKLHTVADQIRLVSAGVTLSKQSKSDSESGRIRMFYNRT